MAKAKTKPSAKKPASKSTTKKTAAAKAIETPPAAAVAVETVSTFKGFDAEMRCRGFQYEVGKTYEHKGKVAACNSGFHACEHPLNVLHYYHPATSRFARVTQSGSLSRHDEDTKVASAKITIEAEIRLPELIEAAVKWVFDRAKWTTGKVVEGANEGALNDEKNGAATASGRSGAATASGEYGAATASGRSGAATASGGSGAATASGWSGAATASGWSGAATASGRSGAATASGEKSTATAAGRDGRAKGVDGAAIFLAYRDLDWNIVHVFAGVVGRGGIKPDTWYKLDQTGAPVECGRHD